MHTVEFMHLIGARKVLKINRLSIITIALYGIPIALSLPSRGMHCCAGGALVKSTRWFLLLALIGFTASTAMADGVDPTVIIRKGCCSILTTSGGSDANPLIITDGSITDFLLAPGFAPTSTLYVRVIPFEGEDFTFFENELWNCASGFLNVTCLSAVVPFGLETPAVEFAFLGPQGFFAPGLDLGVSATATPEPGTILLLLVGMICLIAFVGKRRSPLASLHSPS